MFKLFLVTIVFGFASCDIYNYCDTDLCKGTGFDHITCEATGDFGPKCSSDARTFELDGDVIQKIVDSHNKYRNKIASGEEKRFKTAAKMATMEWSEELAEYAGLNVRRCEYNHDCHATPQMKYNGQNIYAVFAYVDDMNDLAVKSADLWYSEIENATMSNVNDCCSLKVGHFTQMIADRANRVGCAAAQFNNNGKMTMLTCNYSFGNLSGSKLYVQGPPASKCKTGNNPKYPALCSTSEEIDANDGGSQ